MPRDIFGNLIKEDPWTGKKIPQKQLKREVLGENKRKGKAEEEEYKFNAMLRGVEVKRAPHGQDYIERERNLLTGKVTTTHVEIKSGNAKLSKLQQKTKKNKKNYRVYRGNPLFY